ncbi:phosphatase PAP2 family protein [Helicobacter sp. MIT 21-1697]|uniref:phosphatase PAP2 family protein n=1 Tax=Helicobacter sp. MIT 21-1697 TaxID=2993733 RepID=UPI00224B0465|nr:phosphatase PAP2 family protein [Helicobacter sp. MIT 21-1697]MCX2716643.1 phosphatase PAP2 family protein [Helicobacter sp. MIT 21-1697]
MNLLHHPSPKVNLAAMCIIAVCAVGLWLYEPRLYSDVFRLMLLPLGLLWLVQKRYTLLKHFIFISVVILGIAFMCKYTFSFMANHYADSLWVEHIIQIAKRPINGEFKGFPSGHTTAAFIAAAFALRYMGKKWGIFVIVLASMVGYARVLSLWHTPTQVCAGAIFGFIGSLVLIHFINKKPQ